MGLSNVRTYPLHWGVRNSEGRMWIGEKWGMYDKVWEYVLVLVTIYMSILGRGWAEAKEGRNTADKLLGVPEAQWHWSSRPLSISLPDRGNWIVHKNGNWAMLFSCAQADTKPRWIHPKINVPAHKQICSLTKKLLPYTYMINNMMAMMTSNNAVVLFEHEMNIYKHFPHPCVPLLFTQWNTSNRRRANKQRQKGEGAHGGGSKALSWLTVCCHVYYDNT